MKKIITLLTFWILTFQLYAQVSYIKGDSLNINFGNSVTVLQNGNYIVTDPNWKNENNVQNVGAVYLYNGATHQLISKLTGSHTNDRIGSKGVKALSNSNFLVFSPNWNNNFGALTLVNGLTGLNTEINVSNSIIGQEDYNGGFHIKGIGSEDVTILPNGNFLYKGGNSSAYPNDDINGYIIWIDANKGTRGTIGDNLVHGEVSYLDERIGNIQLLSNNNYIIKTPNWGGFTYPGKMTWWDGSTGKIVNGIYGNEPSEIDNTQILELSTQNFLLYNPFLNNNMGQITWIDKSISYDKNWNATNGSNKITGTNANDMIGAGGITELPNGNVVIRNMRWNNVRGAITMINGNTGFTANAGFLGAINSSNSLTGQKNNDNIGSGGIHVLTNGNFVIQSPDWGTKRGAVTWINGTTGITGELSAANSIVGDSTNSEYYIWYVKVLTLPNGNFLIHHSGWGDGRGIVAWVDGSIGAKGSIDSTQCLVGNNAYKPQIGTKIFILPNSNYVISSPYYPYPRNIGQEGSGAITWGNGSTGTKDEVNFGNSLTGHHYLDIDPDITILANSSYVVTSRYGGKGAVTWSNGKEPLVERTWSNSIFGTSTNEYETPGYTSIIPLANGNFLIRMERWHDNPEGSITWINGNTGITGDIREINSSNSLVGSPDYKVGDEGIITFPNGSYIIKSSTWPNNQGALTWSDGNSPITGVIGINNSLMGANTEEKIVDSKFKMLVNGNIVVSNPNWGNKKGAVTLINRNTGLTGYITASNSIVGSNDNDQIGTGIDSLPSGNFIIRSSNWNNKKGAVTWADGNTALSGTVNSTNSLIGSSQNDLIGSAPVIVFPNKSYAIKNQYWNQNKGAITFLKDSTLVSGEINACNSLLGNIVNTGGQLVTNFNNTYNYLLTSTGNSANNFYGIQYIDSDSTSQYYTFSVNIEQERENFSNACETIASLAPSGTDPVNGLVTAKMWKNTPNLPKEFVNRHFELTPASNPNSTGTVTLYFTQDDFNIYNNKNSTKLPTSSTDELNKQNLVVEKHSGTSNDNTGLPNTYQSQAVNIVIHPDSVKWLANEQKWAVSFDVKDFSGFFLKSRVDQLPLKWLNVYAKKHGEQTATIHWQVQENDVRDYAVEKSTDGVIFSMMNHQSSKGDGVNGYVATDNHFTESKAFYRIQQTDNNGNKTFSNIISITNNNSQVSIYPNPAQSYIVINVPNNFIGQNAVITDINGRIRQSIWITGIAQTVNVNNFNTGIYHVKFDNGTILKLMKH